MEYYFSIIAFIEKFINSTRAQKSSGTLPGNGLAVCVCGRNGRNEIIMLPKVYRRRRRSALNHGYYEVILYFKNYFPRNMIRSFTYNMNEEIKALFSCYMTEQKITKTSLPCKKKMKYYIFYVWIVKRGLILSQHKMLLQ